MKKLNIKMMVMLACMTFGLANVAKAQIYSSEDCFYAQEGSSSVSYVVKFEYSKDRVWLKSVSSSTVKKNLAKSEDFYENEIWTDGKNSVTMYEYDYQKSTSSREVYKRQGTTTYDVWNSNGQKAPFDSPGWTHKETVKNNKIHYVAFSTDSNISSFIKWYEYEGDIREKRCYSRVPKEDLLPKATNYDFLD